MKLRGKPEPLLIRGGRVIDPAQGIDAEMDVLLADGVVRQLGHGLEAEGARVFGARGLWVVPGLIDMHVHLREPGEEWKEDIASGTRAAAAGGFTTVVAMANTRPPVDDASMVNSVLARAAEKAVVHVLPVGAVTRGLEGKELAEMGDMAEAGAVAFSDDGHPIADAEVMRCALEYGRVFGKPIIDHCQEPSLTRDAVMHLGYWSTVLGLRGMPAAAEEIVVARDIMLARLTGGRVHIAHASTRGTVDLLRGARAEGLPVTAEVTPTHLCLTDRLVHDTWYDTNTKVNPPLRAAEDVEALRRALAEGVIDAIATDHAPHHLDDKDVEYNYAAFGISALETAVPLLLTELVHPGLIAPGTLIERLTAGPARILGLDAGSLPVGRQPAAGSAPVVAGCRRVGAGSLRVGGCADVTVIDPGLERTVDPERFYSKGRNTPLGGRKLRGWPVLTVVAGHVVMRDGEVLA
ncbi:MAG: dihydroorotase [Bacillota bacterium]